MKYGNIFLTASFDEHTTVEEVEAQCNAFNTIMNDMQAARAVGSIWNHFQKFVKGE